MIDKSTKIVDLAARAGGTLSTDRRGYLQIPDGIEDAMGHDDDYQAFVIRELLESAAALKDSLDRLEVIQAENAATMARIRECMAEEQEKIGGDFYKGVF